MELIRLIHWIDHQAGRAVFVFQTSPAWFFVTVIGTLSIGLTVALFVSMVDQTSVQRRIERVRPVAALQSGRLQLERNHEWVAEDRWRVAHLFVPNKPAEGPKNIQIDSRLMTPATKADDRLASLGAARRSAMRRARHEREFDVRLDLSRPPKAQQGVRLVDGLVRDSESTVKQRESRIRRREQQLLVQASWEFGSECSQFNYVGLPVRRTIPIAVPLPPSEPELPIQPIRNVWPDLSFEMEMIRHSSTAGMFPPGARLVSQSKRSEFPLDDPRVQIGLSSYSDSHWQHFHHASHNSIEELPPYTGLGFYEAIAENVDDDDEGDLTLSSTTEVELRVELISSRNGSAGLPHETKIYVSNQGQDTIPRIEVKDFLSHSQIVVAATPDASVETSVDSVTGTEHRNWHREIQSLLPKDGQEFDLRWIADSTHRQFQKTRVIAQAAVAATTEVSRPENADQKMPSIPPEKLPEPHPALACDFQYFEKATVGDEVSLEIAVRNTGDTVLHNVQVRVELPEQFSHRDGKSIVFDAGTLPVSGRNQTILTMSAIGKGDAVNILQVAATEQVVARGQARILVVEREKTPPPDAPKPAPEVPKPVPAKTVIPAPSQPVNGCCCQQLSMMDFEFVYPSP